MGWLGFSNVQLFGANLLQNGEDVLADALTGTAIGGVALLANDVQTAVSVQRWLVKIGANVADQVFLDPGHAETTRFAQLAVMFIGIEAAGGVEKRPFSRNGRYTPQR